MTTKEEAFQMGMHYAWGREDAGGTKTIAKGDVDGVMAFAVEYARGYEDFNQDRRSNMIPVRDAYDHWQESGGRSIFKKGELTLTKDQQHALRDAWPQFHMERNGTAETYWALREQFQNEAWEEAI